MTVVLGSTHILRVKLVVERGLEACPRWCSGKPKADATAASACRACCGVTTGTCWPLVDGSAAFAGACGFT
jgi:hypothetical protein